MAAAGGNIASTVTLVVKVTVEHGVRVVQFLNGESHADLAAYRIDNLSPRHGVRFEQRLSAKDLKTAAAVRHLILGEDVATSKRMISTTAPTEFLAQNSSCLFAYTHPSLLDCTIRVQLQPPDRFVRPCVVLGEYYHCSARATNNRIASVVTGSSWDGDDSNRRIDCFVRYPCLLYTSPSPRDRG